jgi:hypothetical protein
MNSTYKLSDDVIAALGKLLQLAILTGTDVTDWFRMIEVTHDPEDGSKLIVDPGYTTRLEQQIEELERKAHAIVEELEGESN